MEKSRAKTHKGLANLIPGKGRGPKPGEGGRPPSVIRQQLRGSFADRIGFLESVVNGEPMMRIRFLLGAVGKHCVCANCGEREIVPDSPESSTIEVEVMTSASVSDRLKAMDLLAKYGLGTSNEINDGRPDRLPTAEERRDRVLELISPPKRTA